MHEVLVLVNCVKDEPAPQNLLSRILLPDSVMLVHCDLLCRIEHVARNISVLILKPVQNVVYLINRPVMALTDITANAVCLTCLLCMCCRMTSTIAHAVCTQCTNLLID